ncbi:polyphosphate polymerase domain-containing protein [Candidatus Sumerlaeota bacterium]|nr:polyphosphate polymerase domain-containing protein [Candidatus Sumerlaeota bacterium]
MKDNGAHNTTAQRFEAKYHLTEREAHQMSMHLEPFLIQDPHVKCYGDSYPINSLYLDNDALSLYWSSMLGEKNRIKLRIRAYSADENEPVIFEIKRRINQVILKDRAFMHRQVIRKMLDRQVVVEEDFANKSARDKAAFYQFRDYLEQLDAKPKVMVWYMREPYISRLGDAVRITFDRKLSALEAPEYSNAIWQYDHRWRQLDAPVILEIKFSDNFPVWVQDFVRHFGLRQDNFAKYCYCMHSLKREGAMQQWGGIHDDDIMWTSRDHVIMAND